MKKIIAVLMLFVMCLSLTACSKESITIEEFIDEAESVGAEISEDVDLGDNKYADDIKQAVYAETDEWKAIFYEISDKLSAEVIYKEYVDNLDDSVSSAKSESRMDGTNFARFSLNAGGKFNLVVYVDNTLLIMEGPSDNKDEIKEFAKELGYN